MRTAAILVMAVFYTALLFPQSDTLYAVFLHKDMNEGKIVIVKKEDNNKEFTIQKGEMVQIELEGTGSTGYWWYLTTLDSEYVKLVSEETKALTKGKTGAPVLSIWRFQTLKKGTAEIGMDYYRTWEGKERALEHFLIRLIIKD